MQDILSRNTTPEEAEQAILDLVDAPSELKAGKDTFTTQSPLYAGQTKPSLEGFNGRYYEYVNDLGRHDGQTIFEDKDPDGSWSSDIAGHSPRDILSENTELLADYYSMRNRIVRSHRKVFDIVSRITGQEQPFITVSHVALNNEIPFNGEHLDDGPLLARLLKSGDIKDFRATDGLPHLRIITANPSTLLLRGGETRNASNMTSETDSVIPKPLRADVPDGRTVVFSGLFGIHSGITQDMVVQGARTFITSYTAKTTRS